MKVNSPINVTLPPNEHIIQIQQLNTLASTHKNTRRTRRCGLWIGVGIFIAFAPLTLWAYKLILEHLI